MIRPAFQDVELPLMDHLVGQCVDDFLLAIFALLEYLLEQGQREANFALDRGTKTHLSQARPRSSTAHEHADRGGQPAAPGEIDLGQQTSEISAVQIAPHLGQMLGGYRGR